MSLPNRFSNSVPDNKKTALRFFEHMGAGDLDAAFALLTHDATWWVPSEQPGGTVIPKDAMRQGTAAFYQVFAKTPVFTIGRVTAEDNRVCVEQISRDGRTHGGAGYGNDYHMLIEFRDGLIREVKEYMNPLCAAAMMPELTAMMAGQEGAPAATELPWPDAALKGTYETRVCASAAQWGSGALVESVKYFHRSYIFGDGDFTARYTFFADVACMHPLFGGTWHGTYQVGPVAPAVAGAREIDTQIRTQSLVILAAEMLDLVSDCGTAPWVIGIERDVTKGGCTRLGQMFSPLTADSADYDIVVVTPDGIRVGLRTPDMRVSPTCRPTQMQDALPATRYVP